MKVEITIVCPSCSGVHIKKNGKKENKNKITAVMIAEDNLLQIMI